MAFMYQVTVRGVYFAQRIINVFSYLSGGAGSPTPSAFDLLKAMGFVLEGDPPIFVPGSLAAGFRRLTSEHYSFTEVEARNLYSVTDFYSLAYNPAVPGLSSGSDLSPAVAYGFFSNRVRLDIKRGFKRIVGVEAEACGDGGVIVAPYVGFANTLATQMSAILDGDLGATYAPSVFQFEKYTTPSGKSAYRPYEDEAVGLTHVAAGVTFSPYLETRTQVSRQYGRGS